MIKRSLFILLLLFFNTAVLADAAEDLLAAKAATVPAEKKLAMRKAAESLVSDGVSNLDVAQKLRLAGASDGQIITAMLDAGFTSAEAAYGYATMVMGDGRRTKGANARRAVKYSTRDALSSAGIDVADVRDGSGDLVSITQMAWKVQKAIRRGTDVDFRRVTAYAAGGGATGVVVVNSNGELEINPS
jgi:hypothetical protein